MILHNYPTSTFHSPLSWRGVGGEAFFYYYFDGLGVRLFIEIAKPPPGACFILRVWPFFTVFLVMVYALGFF